MQPIKDRFISFIQQLQNDICNALEQCDGNAMFKTDKWQREDGGDGTTRIIANGAVFEKGGVNTSVVYGAVTDVMRKQLNSKGSQWFACGISSVIHPINPFVPTVHFNYRYFELYNENEEMTDSWFGGGTDLTPYYLFEEDVKHFHTTYKNICNGFDANFYEAFKINCDDYFVNKHRNNERRGVGGIFFDYQRPTATHDSNTWLNFANACGNAFLESYIPIVNKRKNFAFAPAHKYWQEIRRGRYVEFNLIHDRGTLFGLQSNGRTESILMSLPPTVRFEYDYQPLPDSDEYKLLKVCLKPVHWVDEISE